LLCVCVVCVCGVCVCHWRVAGVCVACVWYQIYNNTNIYIM